VQQAAGVRRYVRSKIWIFDFSNHLTVLLLLLLLPPIDLSTGTAAGANPCCLVGIVRYCL